MHHPIRCWHLPLRRYVHGIIDGHWIVSPCCLGLLPCVRVSARQQYDGLTGVRTSHYFPGKAVRCYHNSWTAIDKFGEAVQK